MAPMSMPAGPRTTVLRAGVSKMTVRVGQALIAVAAIALFVVSPPSTLARSAPGGVVSTEGRVGVFTLGKTTERQVRARHGRSHQRTTVRDPTLVYRCGVTCRTRFTFSSKTRRLVQFSTGSLRYRTPKGTRVGDTSDAAEAREGKAFPFGTPCLLSMSWLTQRAWFHILASEQSRRVTGFLSIHRPYAPMDLC